MLLAGIVFPIPYLLHYAQGDLIGGLWETLTSDYAQNTYQLMAFTAFWALLFAVPAAWVVSVYSFKGRSLLQRALYLPLAIPAYIIAYTYKGALGPYGTTHQLFGQFYEIDQLSYLAIFMASVLYPYVYAVSRAVFEQQSITLIQASLNLGRSPTQTLLRVVLPLALPAILSSLTLVIMEVLSNYGAVKYFGIDTFTTEMIRWWSPVKYHRVISLAFSVLIVVLLIFIIKRVVAKRGRSVDRYQKKASAYKKPVKGAAQLICVALCLTPLLIGFIIPVCQLAAWSYQVGGEIWDDDLTRALLNTFKMASSAACLTVTVAVLLRYSSRVVNRGWFSLLLQSSLIGYALPGVVIGIGILVPLAQINQRYGVLLTDAAWVLIWAYVIRFFAVSFHSIDGAFSKRSISSFQASRNMGQGYLMTLWRVELPQIKAGLVGAAIMVFVDVTKELPLTKLFQSFNFETLAIRSFELMETDGAVYDAALPSLMIIAVGLTPVLLLNKHQ